MSQLCQTYEVLVCTYNGAEYIAEQLNSIILQQPPPTRILVSDDGSTDATLSIVMQIASSVDIPICIIFGPQNGIVSNLLNGLVHVETDYVFLADQDDIWLAGKAAQFCEKMLATSEPHLIFSDALVWLPDTNTRIPFWKHDGLLPGNSQDPRKLVFHNCIQGASMAINQALIKRVILHPHIAMHDWWIGLVASSLGTVTVISQPTLLYRQHEHNQIGSRRTKKQPGGFAHKKQKAERVLRQAYAFSHLYAGQVKAEYADFFTAFNKAMSGNAVNKIGFLLRYRPTRKNLLRTLTLWLSIFFIRITESQTSR
jgi:rhamnosyltransferase